jgi:Uma2 family endonuclease
MRVRELWLIDPEAKTIEVRSFESGRARLYKADEIVRSEVLPKIEIPVSTIF